MIVKKKRKWLKWVIIVAVLAALAAVFILPGLRTASEAAYSSEVATRGDIETYYSFSGEMELAKSETHAAISDCEVRDVYVSEGDMVKKGDRLMRLSDGRTLKAGIDGEITDVTVARDDSVTAGQLLVEVADFDSMRVSFDVDEFDVESVSVGMDAQVTIDALEYSFTSPVTRISKTAQSTGDITYYKARVEPDVTTLPKSVLPGMRVDVKIAGASAHDAVLLRMDALSFDEYNKPFVLVQEGDEKVVRYIETGINDGVYVEVLSGLEEGETAYYARRLKELEEVMKFGNTISSGAK